MKFNVHGGHAKEGAKYCGASGLLNESREDRLITNKIISLLKENGHTVYNCTVDSGTSQTNVLQQICTKCNQHSVDWDISIHLNSGRNDYAGDGSIGGFEIWVTEKSTEKTAISNRICSKMEALGFRNRGIKTTSNLYFLNHTNSKALLLEVCFVDDADDYELYNKLGYETICKAIVEGILNTTLSGTTTTSTTSTSTSSTSTKEIYRVRKTWADASSQIGAYYELNNAINACKTGYKVFNSKGTVVYTLTASTSTNNSTTSSTSSTTSTTTKATSTSTKLTVDGLWGKDTTIRLQEIFGTTKDGIVSNQSSSLKSKNPGLITTSWNFVSNASKTSGSQLIKAIQKKVGTTQDGLFGTNTCKAMQKWLGTTQDGIVSKPSQMVKALQTWCNNQ